MKKFEVISEDKKRCPDCGEAIAAKWKSAFCDEWCPYCGCNIDEVFSEEEE